MTDKPDFRRALLSRHGERDWICVSAYKTVNGKFIVSERFCNGVDEAANLIERSYQRDDIGAIWTNLQKLKPGSSRRKKGETVEAYTNILVDIDRRWKMAHQDGSLCKHTRDERKACGASKCNATDAEREVLYGVAEKVNGFVGKFLGDAVFADSGNGYHIARRCVPLDPATGSDLYSQILALLRVKFESPDVNMEIDLSLADETQVVTAWGTWNRKYPDMPDRPQRQSKILYMPTPIKEVSEIDLILFLEENGIVTTKFAEDQESEPAKPKKRDWQKANPDWAENYGVPHLVEHFAKYIAYEQDGEFEKDGDVYHALTPCFAHADEPDGHEHDKPRDSCIIMWQDGGVGLSCWNKDFGLKSMIRVLNEKIVADGGEKYPILVFAEESDAEIAKAFGVEDADAVPTPVGELCYRANCNCGLVHVQRPKPQELFDEGDKSFDLVRTELKGGGFSGLRVLRVSDSPDRPVDWLWPNRLPAGSAFTVSGPIGCNKSMALLDIASRITNGADWPDGEKNEFGERQVLICATEDELQTVIRPRLRACGANLEKCLYLKNAFDVDKNGTRKSRAMDLESDTQRLYEALLLPDNGDILLVILDPLTGFYGNADPNDNRKIRKMVTKVAKMCMKTRIAVACIVHENKKSDVNAVDKMMGASSLSQIIRAGMRFSFDTEKRNGRIMASLKNSFGERGGGMKFDVGQMDLVSTEGLPLKNIGYVKWTETHSQTADEVKVAQAQQEENGGEEGKLAVAMRIISDALQNGKRLQREVHGLLDQWERENGQTISDETRKRARRKTGAVGNQGAPFYWWLRGREYATGSPERVVLDQEIL